MEYLLRNLSELAEKRAKNIREEAQMWDILSRDLKREAKRKEERLENKIPQPTNMPPQAIQSLENKLYVKVSKASELMGMGRTYVYN